MKVIIASELTASLDSHGYTQVKSFLNAEDCKSLWNGFANEDLFRKTIVMERYRFGLGVYKYYRYPLPDQIRSIRHDMYRILAPVANEWMRRLNIDTRYPDDWNEFKAACESKGQAL